MDSQHVAIDIRSWVSLSLPSRRVVLSLNLVFKQILFYACAISCLQGHEIYSPGLRNLSPKEKAAAEASLPRSNHLSAISPHPQLTFWAWTLCPHFPFQIPGDPMSSSLQPLIYLFLSFASRVPLLTWLEINCTFAIFAVGFLSNYHSSRRMKLNFSLSSHCSLLSSGILIAPLILVFCHLIILLRRFLWTFGWRKIKRPIIFKEEIVKKNTGERNSNSNNIRINKSHCFDFPEDEEIFFF